jgi:hypothetical protein
MGQHDAFSGYGVFWPPAAVLFNPMNGVSGIPIRVPRHARGLPATAGRDPSGATTALAPQNSWRFKKTRPRAWRAKTMQIQGLIQGVGADVPWRSGPFGSPWPKHPHTMMTARPGAVLCGLADVADGIGCCQSLPHQIALRCRMGAPGATACAAAMIAFVSMP